MKTMKNIPLYKYPETHAREHSGLSAYRASMQANIACKKAIEAAIRDHHHDDCLDSEAAKQVVGQFGYDRVFYVLANTVQQKEWDGRFAYDTRRWSKTIPVLEDRDSWGTDRNRDFVVNSHSCLTDLFIKQVRDDFARACRQEGKTFHLPYKAANYKNLFEVLCGEQQVARPLLRELIAQKRLYESIQHRACFVCQGPDGTPCGTIELDLATGGWTTARNSSPGRGFLICGKAGARAVTVFATPVDLVKHLTARGCTQAPEDLLALGYAQYTTPLLTYLQEHPDVSTVRLAFGTGMEARTAVRWQTAALPEHLRVEEISPEPPAAPEPEELEF